MGQQVTVFAYMKAKPGREDKLKAEALKVVELTRKEDGCLQYDLHVHTGDPTRFAYYEIWTSDDHLAAHARSEHMNAFRQMREDLLDGPVTIETYRRTA